MFTNNPLTKWYNKLKEFAKKKADDTIFTAYNPGGIVIGHGAGPAKAECLIPVYDARHGGRLDWNGDPERFILFGPAPRTLDGSDPELSVAEVIRDVFGSNNGPIESVMVVSGDPNGYTGVLRLTAREAGAEANNIVFTSSQRKDYTLSEPCFGEHVIKMGSFSPGLGDDASVSDCKIMLNGEELTTGEAKAKTWFCRFITETEAGCDFGYLKTTPQDEVELSRAYQVYQTAQASSGTCAAIIKFKTAKSLAEVNKWLMTEYNMMSSGDDYSHIYNYGGDFNFAAIGVCTWSDDESTWPESN